MLTRTSKVEDFLSGDEEAQVIEAIRTAEKNTSGEIRVHLEAKSELPPLERAQEVFNFLHMNNTRHGNGVLIYVAVETHTLVILGDRGINEKVANNFWESTRDLVLGHFKKGEMKDGLVSGILMAGEQLKSHFPYQVDDRDELSNEISTS